MLNKCPNRACVSEDHCWVTILSVVPYCCYWVHVEEHFEKIKESMGTAWHSFENLVRHENPQKQ
jgi:hypothetical protein